MSTKQNDVFDEAVKEANEELKVKNEELKIRIDQELLGAIHSIQFVYEQIKKLA